MIGVSLYIVPKEALSFMKWDNLELTDSELGERCILRMGGLSPCHVCGELTEYIDYCYVENICSEECQKSFDKKMSQ